MKFLRSWLQEYVVESLPSDEELINAVNKQAFEFEGIERTGDDTVIEFDIKPNRTHDAQSYLGMAKEIATLFDLTFKKPEPTYSVDGELATSGLLSITAPDRTFSPRVMKRIITDVKIGESPDWLKNKLETLGQRSINNIVDITNFVMLETGQPGHAFDYDKIAGTGAKNVFLRKATAGEKVPTLDGKTYELADTMWVWADDEKALDIAGVKGGSASGIDEKTTTIMLSVCTFHPTMIRKTSRPLGLLTDASKRYEQGLSPELPAWTLDRLCGLIQEIAGGRIAHDTIDLYPRRRHPYFFGASLREVNELLGSKITAEEMEDILRRLGFSYRKAVPLDEILRLAPTFVDVPYRYGASVSFDCPQMFDCGSFVNYLYAQNGIGLPRMAQDQFMYTEEISEREAQPGDLVFSSTDSDGKIEHIDSLDIDQMRQTKQTVEFLPGKTFPTSIDHVGIYLGEGKIIHASPMSDKGKVVVEDIKSAPKFRTIVGFRRVARGNEERYVVEAPPERLDLIASRFLLGGTTADLIEEIGRVYAYDNIPAVPLVRKEGAQINKSFYYINKIRDILVGIGFSEVYTYSLTEQGDVELANPLASDKAYVRATLAGGLLGAFESNGRQASFLGTEETLIFEIGTVFTKEGEFTQLGIMGMNGRAEEAARALEEQLGIPLQKGYGSSEGFGYFLNLTEYIAALPDPASYDDLRAITTQGKSFAPISAYPFVLRDIAVWVPDADGNGESILAAVKKEAGDLFVRGDLFDTFGKDGKTSYAYHLVFQSHEKTLSDVQVNEIMGRITDALNGREGWKVR
jgi:phenylalanyl-tRNA synthetase beta subunit